jgi:hypothetical protein
MNQGELKASRASSGAEAREPDLRIDKDTQVSSEAKAWEPDLGTDLNISLDI